MGTMLTASMVSALRGAPITILVLLMIERKPLAMEYIRRHTRYSQNTISDSMALLADYGMVIQTARYVYQIADGVQQLPLMAMELDSGEEEPERENVIDAEFRSQNLRAEDAPQSNRSDESEIRSQNLRAVNATNDPVTKENEIRSQKMRPNSTNKPTNSARSQKFRARSQILRPATLASSSLNLESRNLEIDLARGQQIQKNLECLDRYGVREPARTRLAHLEHVTDQLINYHCEQSPNISLAIYRIEHNWEIGEVNTQSNAGIFELDDQVEDSHPPENTFPKCELWIMTTEFLKQNWIGAAGVRTWLESTPAKLIGKDLWLYPKNPYSRKWIEDHLETIQKAIGKLSDSVITVQIEGNKE